MQEDRQPSGHGDLGFLEADAFHQPEPPGLEPAPVRHAGEQHAGGLTTSGTAAPKPTFPRRVASRSSSWPDIRFPLIPCGPLRVAGGPQFRPVLDRDTVFSHERHRNVPNCDCFRGAANFCLWLLAVVKVFPLPLPLCPRKRTIGSESPLSRRFLQLYPSKRTRFGRALLVRV